MKETLKDRNNKTGQRAANGDHNIEDQLVVYQDDHNIYVLCNNNESFLDPDLLKDILDYEDQIYKEETLIWMLTGAKGEPEHKPIYTLVLNTSGKEWDIPGNLYEMLDLNEIPDYLITNACRIKALDPAKLTEKEVESYMEPLKILWKLLRKCSNRMELVTYLKENQEALIRQDEKFQDFYAIIIEENFPEIFGSSMPQSLEELKERSLEEILQTLMENQEAV